MARIQLAAFAPALLFIACVCACSSARASDYRFELGFLAENQDTQSFDLDITGSGATVYFRKVRDEGQPVPERAFLQRAGHIQVFDAQLDLEQKLVPLGYPPNLGGNTFGGSFRFSGPGSPVALSGFFRQSVLPDIVYTFPFSGTNRLEFEVYGAELWFFLGAYSALTIGAGEELLEETGPGPGAFPEQLRFLAEVRFKTVRPLAPPRWVNIEFGAGFSDHDHDGLPSTQDQIRDKIFFRFDVYPLPTIGFGGGLIITKADDPADEGTTIEARLTLNAGSKVGLSVAYERFEPRDQSFENEERIAVQLVARF